MARPLRPEECHRKPEAGRGLGAHLAIPDDGSGISKYRRWNAWLRENTGESTSGIAVTSARTHRAVERSSRRAPVTVRSIKRPPRKLSLPDVAGGRGRSIVPTARSSQRTGKGVQRGSEGTEKTSNGTALHVSVRGVRQWPDDGNSWINRTGRGRDGVAARVSQEARLGTGRGSFPRDVEHSRDPPESPTSTHSGTIQDVRTRSCSPRRMHRASPNWHTFYAKFFYTARAPSRKAQHRR